MAERADAPRARCLCLDIETARQDQTALRELGVFRPDLALHRLPLVQSAALQARVAEHPDAALCLHFLLSPEPGKGVANFFASLRRALRPSLSEVVVAWQWALRPFGARA